jgi:hypothetical protein
MAVDKSAGLEFENSHWGGKNIGVIDVLEPKIHIDNKSENKHA